MSKSSVVSKESRIFGVRLKKVRREEGITQQKLADLAGMARSDIAKYESGRANPQLPNAVRLAVALNVSLDWMTGRDDL